MSKIGCLVTGGAGFIGSHLCKALIEKDYRVICVDNLITGDRRNIKGLLRNPQFVFMEQDVIDPIENWKLKIENCNFIYHLASPASPIQYQKYPLETLKVNSIGTYNLLELARDARAKLLFVSTSEVYGDPLEHPQKETYWGNVNSFGPRACYDESKRFGEALVYTFVHKFHVDALIVRIFNTYGPHMEKDDGRVISNFIDQALNNKPITIYGDGTQTRSFCYVTDMVDGLIRAMEQPQTAGEVINLGNPDERTVADIAKRIKELTASPSSIRYQELPSDDPSRRKPDITKATALLGWKPLVGFTEGLKLTIDYFE